MKKPLIFFDTETTGTNPAWDKIIDLYALKLYPDGTSDELYIRLNPGRHIPAEATAVHGITDSDVSGYPLFAEKASLVWEFFKGCDLCAHNLPYDLELLERHFAGTPIKGFPEEETQMLDTLVIYRRLYPASLSAIYERLMGLPMEDAHTAKADVLAVQAIFHKMKTVHGLSDKDVSRISAGKKADPYGKLYWNEAGEMCFAFGKNKGRHVKDELDYCDWMLKGKFPPSTLKALKKYLDK